MISQDLEASLHTAYVEARRQRHEVISVEHLALALLDNPAARKVLEGCRANMKALRDDLTRHITENTPLIPPEREVDTHPTLGFQRVIQRAILQEQSSVQPEVTGANVLLAVYGEKNSHAMRLLLKHGATRLDVVKQVSPDLTEFLPAEDLAATQDSTMPPWPTSVRALNLDACVQ